MRNIGLLLPVLIGAAPSTSTVPTIEGLLENATTCTADLREARTKIAQATLRDDDPNNDMHYPNGSLIFRMSGKHTVDAPLATNLVTGETDYQMGDKVGGRYQFEIREKPAGSDEWWLTDGFERSRVGKTATFVVLDKYGSVALADTKDEIAWNIPEEWSGTNAHKRQFLDGAEISDDKIPISEIPQRNNARFLIDGIGVRLLEVFLKKYKAACQAEVAELSKSN